SGRRHAAPARTELAGGETRGRVDRRGGSAALRRHIAGGIVSDVAKTEQGSEQDYPLLVEAIFRVPGIADAGSQFPVWGETPVGLGKAGESLAAHARSRIVDQAVGIGGDRGAAGGR